MKEKIFKGKTLRELRNSLFKDSEVSPIWIVINWVDKDGKVWGGHCEQTTYKRLLETNSDYLDKKIESIGISKVKFSMFDTRILIPEFIIKEVKERRK